MRLLAQFGCLLVAVYGVSLVGCGGSPDPAPAASSTPESDPTMQPGPGSTAATDPAAMESPEMAAADMMTPGAMPADAGGGEDAYMSPEMSEMEASVAANSSAAMEQAYGAAAGGAEAMYGGAAGMPGGARPAAGSPLVASLSQGVQSQMADRMLTAVKAASSTKTAEKTPSMRDRANEAFVGGDEALALRYLYAHMVSEYDQANGTLGSVSFSPVLREPVWWLRWGVSLHVRADDADSPHPIVKGMSSPLPERSATRGGYGNRGRAGASPRAPAPAAAPGMEGMEMEGMGMGMGMGGTPPRSSTPVAAGVSPQIDETLYSSLGLISEQVGTQLDTRFQNGSFGRGFTGVEVAPAAAAPAARSMRVDQRTGERIEEPTTAADASYEMAASGMQQPAPVTMPGAMEASEMMMMESMQGQGGVPGPGAVPGAGPGPGAGAGPGAAAAAEPAAASFQPDLPRWRPGLAYLGKVPLSESLESAKENDLQFVLHFDVIVQGKKTRTIIRVVNVADGETVVASKKLDNVECFKLVEAERTTEAEYVADVVMPMFVVLDEKLKVVPMPTLTTEQALSRVSSLLESAPDFDWHSMAEVRLFQSQGLLDEQQVSAAMHLFGGDDALVLLYGTPAERREIVSRRLEE